MSKPTAKAVVPELRFPEFRDAGEWDEKLLGSCLDYFQPTKYLVKSTAYKDSYKTPVLTAGKTFVLGYTDETHGIFTDKLPVIIFDDFTTATKFVDFPFKAKSSAMKILLAKEDVNIKFIYEAMQVIKYEIGAHERHWISKFAKLNIAIPTPSEQQKIADCLSSIDELITAHTQKHEALKTHKKGLMQQLFPATGETVPKLRFPAFRGAGEWEEKTLKDISSINQGLQIPIAKRFTEKVENSYFYITNKFLLVNSDTAFYIKNPPESVLCDEDDILMTRTGNTGKVVTNVRGAFHNNFFKIKYSDEIFKDFLVYFLRSESTQKKILSLAGASTIPDLNHGDFYRIEIQLPSMLEQQKIANSLSSIDDLITAQAQKIESLKAHKKGLMQQLFPTVDEVIA